MELIEFFKNLFKTPKPSYFEDLYFFDYPALLERATFTEKELRPNGVTRYKYDVKLESPFLNIFEKLRIELFQETKKLNLEDMMVLTFSSNRQSFSQKEIEHAVYSIVGACKNDINNEENVREAYFFAKGSSSQMTPQLIPAEEGSYYFVDVMIQNKKPTGFYVELAITVKELQKLAKDLIENDSK
ncbi:MAG: hypothetical protein WCG08_15335 [Paludibacter sp.]